MEGYIDMAKLEHKDEWFRHPVIGDPSYDTFIRLNGNPIFKGSPPYEWPVNAYLFKDPESRYWYVYITLYPSGYWPKGVHERLKMVLFRSKDNGESWENLGVVLEGDKDNFDGKDNMPGNVADITLCYDNGLYHMVYGWTDLPNEDGGIAYAVATSPEGPFVRDKVPIHRESKQSLMLGRYKRLYIPSIFKRKNDWLILASTSTPRNVGGTWGLVALTSKGPSGPYSEPSFVIFPQSRKFHPPLVEFNPAFEYDGYIYCPATSIALNRDFQVVYRAEKEKAHLSDAWEPVQFGSCWHSECVPNETNGIWGQTFSGFIDEDKCFNVVFPSRTKESFGTINLARRDWERPNAESGFALSAPNGPSMTFVQRRFKDFNLIAEMAINTSVSLLLGYSGPIGPRRPIGEFTIHEQMLTNFTELELNDGHWGLKQRDDQGSVVEYARGSFRRCSKTDRIRIRNERGNTEIEINNDEVWKGYLAIEPGRLGILLHAGNYVRVNRFEISGKEEKLSQTLLCTEGLIGCGADFKDWTEVANENFRYGFGYISNSPNSIIKWNFFGDGFSIIAPCGPGYGSFKIYLDGEYLDTVDLNHPTYKKAGPVYTMTGLEKCYHAVVQERVSGLLVCDSFEFSL